MKYHLQILRKYLSLDTTPQDIAKNLILKTCEIEEVIERQIPRSIVIGKIEQVEKHPDADKLNICQVNCWTQGKFQIICGGTNVAEGLFVATALVGTPFPEAGITIAKRAMRGVDSEGMICSKGELGINEDRILTGFGILYKTWKYLIRILVVLSAKFSLDWKLRSWK